MAIEFEKLFTEAELTPERKAVLDQEWEPAFGVDDEVERTLAAVEGEPEPTEEDLEGMK